VCGDFRIIACKNGKQQLREGKALRGTFTDADAAKAHAAFLMDQRQPQEPTEAPAPTPEAPPPEPTLEASPEPVAPRRKRTQILGYSACAVLKTLGRAGVKYPEADAILKRHGIEMTKASVSVQLGFGRNEHTWQRHGKPAPLTEEQIVALRDPSVDTPALA
jgi:hypothetical protein